MFGKKKTEDSDLYNNLNIPEHIGIIMDGNGRWAKRRGLPRYAGHSKGAKTFKEISLFCNKLGVKYLTIYSFSTENWKRPQKEINVIIKLFKEYLADVENYKQENVRLGIIGDTSVFDSEMLELIDNMNKLSEDMTGMVLNLAVNYGGRGEIVHAVKQIANEVKNGNLTIDNIDENTISEHIYTKGQPDPDFIIRPSGEFRLSNFMTWQSAYSEFVFMDILWPDFTKQDMLKAIYEYNLRNRRFGGL